MKLIDEQYMKTPFFGSRRITAKLNEAGYKVNRKRVRRLMRLMDIEAIYRKPRTSTPASEHKIYPYLLRGLSIDQPDQVWAADITYLPMRKGFLYLVAIIDWHSRFVLSRRLSNSMETSFCTEALADALAHGRPEIFNTDQGSQFTSDDFTDALKEAGAAISMDGKGRFLDNIFVERLWRSLKYEEVYLKAYEDIKDARTKMIRSKPVIGAYSLFCRQIVLQQRCEYAACRYFLRSRHPLMKTHSTLLRWLAAESIAIVASLQVHC